MDLKDYLKMEDLSGANFARKIGVSTSLIALLVKKKRDTTVTTALKIQKQTKGKVRVRDVIPDSLWLTKSGEIKH